MKKSKSIIFPGIASAYHQLKAGGRPRPVTSGVQTHPTIPMPPLPESEVLTECLDWLKKHRIMADRNNVGAGTLGAKGYFKYGIKGGGDIIGLLPNGKHFEIECKHGKGGRLSVEQVNRQIAIRGNGGLYFVVHGLTELQFLMKDYT